MTTESAMKPGSGSRQTAKRSIRLPEVDSLRTLVYAFSLAICCMYFFKLTSKWWKSKPASTQNTVSEGGIPHTTPPRDVERPNDDVVYQTDGARGQISSLVLLAGGKQVVCVCRAEETMQVWNVEEEEPLTKHSVAVNVISSSKDGQWIVTDVDRKVVSWDARLQQGWEAAERDGRVITALDISPDSCHVASGSNVGTVVIWHLGEPGFPLVSGPSMDHGSTAVSSVKFSPSGNRVASSCADWGSSVKIWHTRTGVQLASIRVDASPTYSLAWSSDGQRLFASYHHGSIACFDTVTEKVFLEVVEPCPGDDSITSLHVSKSDRFLVTFSSPGRTVDIWDIRHAPASKPIRSYSQCVAASCSPDDLYLATVGGDSRISIRSLYGVVDASCFFHCIAPSPSQSEPFTYISPTAYRAWKRGELEEVEGILSREIEDKRYQSFACYTRANRALLRVRRANLMGALDDIDKIITNCSQIPAIAHLAKAMALIWQGKRSEAMDAFTSIQQGDATDLVECIKSTVLFDVEPDRVNSVADCSSPWVKTRKVLLLAERYMRRKEYNEALRLLAEAPDLGPFLHAPKTVIISLAFGWDLYDLECMVQHRLCQALFASGRAREVSELLRVRDNCLDEELEVRKADLGWLNEKLGDEAMRHGNHDDAITWYTVALGLCPESRVTDCGSEFAKRCFSELETVGDAAHEEIAQDVALISRYPPGSARLLVKRSKSLALKECWDDAMVDAEKAIEGDQSCPWGYERKYLALHALQRYEEAAETLGTMVTKLEECADPLIRELRTHYVSPSESIAVIDKQITAIFEISPLVLIDVRTGRLCDAAERIRLFKSDPVFHEIVSSMAAKLDNTRMEQVVARYFRYVMFSHTWEGEEEPKYKDISEKPVYEPDPHPLRQKLRCFCEIARAGSEGYLWAWSDTCCINKAIETVYRKSIRSMYSWYKASALTVVLLARGSTPSALKGNRWMTRAWTLQELLAPKSIRFYDRDWKLYRGDTLPNHKESPDIMRELAEAIDVAQHTLVDFSPGSLSIRAKLRLASTRAATEKVDIAYALIGIFSSDLVPEYRDPEDALGLLLEEIVHRDRDANAVLDWVGTSSQFNSCLPAQISVYQHSPYTPPLVPQTEIDARVAELRTLLPEEDVIAFFESLSSLGSIDFTHRRLSLPCIIFPVSVKTATPDEASSASGQTLLCQAQAGGLGHIQFRASRTAFEWGEEVVLVYPWIRDLLTRTNLPKCDNYTQGLRLVVHIERPFRALLLVKQSVDTYRRVVADTEILISRREMTSLKDIGTKVLQIR